MLALDSDKKIDLWKRSWRRDVPATLRVKMAHCLLRSGHTSSFVVLCLVLWGHVFSNVTPFYVFSYY